MTMISNLAPQDGTPLSARPRGTIRTLENLSGFAEDLCNQSMQRLSDPEALQAAVTERFGPGVTVADVTEALEAIRELSSCA